MKRRTISVDLNALGSIDHVCSGCTDAETCCCTQFDICITEKEMEAIVGLLPEMVEYCPWLAEEDGYRNAFEETDDGLFSIDTVESGLCVFAYGSNDGIRCAVHTVACALSIPLEEVKPSSCVLWPLAISEPRPDQLSICDDALLFHCNTPAREEGRHKISVSLMEAIEQIYGPAVREAIDKAAGTGMHTTKVPLSRCPVSGHEWKEEEQRNFTC